MALFTERVVELHGSLDAWPGAVGVSGDDRTRCASELLTDRAD